MSDKQVAITVHELMSQSVLNINTRFTVRLRFNKMKIQSRVRTGITIYKYMNVTRFKVVITETMYIFVINS